MVVLELEGESFRQNGIGKHIQKTLDRLFEGYVSVYFRFGLDYKLKIRALNYTNPKVLSDQPNDYAIFQATFDLKADKVDPGERKKNRRVRCVSSCIPGRIRQAHDRRRESC